jgi:phage virion morphogenesis protein
MATYTIEIDSNRIQGLLQRLAKAISPDGFKLTMEEIGEDLKYSTQQRFVQGVAPDGTPWKGLSPVTLALRIRRGRPGAKPLIDTGTLKGSVNFDAQPDGLTLFVNRQYGSGRATAAVHQTGTDRAGRGHKVTIPARPFLGVSDSDVDQMERTIVRAIDLAAKGGE